MITKKVQIYTNRINYDLTDFLTYVYQYSAKRGVTFHFDIAPVDVTGYSSVLRPLAGGGNGYVLEGAESLVGSSDGHDVTTFMFDLGEWKSAPNSKYPLREDMPRSSTILYKGKPFINLGFYINDIQNTKVTFLHELYGHALAKIFGCTDVMDSYKLNNFPDAPDGNFAEQTKIFQPYLNPKSAEPTATITRISDNGVETIGTLVAHNNGATFLCSTLELPWKDNKSNVSCIPKGTYPCSVQPFKKTFMYRLSETGKRIAIFLHVGNYFTDIEGCILLGVKPADINHDNQIDVTSSTDTVKAFMQFMGNKPFTLTIE